MKDKHQRRQERRQRRQARAAEMSSPLQNAASLFQSGKAQQAGDILEKFLSDQPDNFDALTLLGVVRATSGDPGAAIPLFENAARIRPGDAGIHINLAKACEEQGRHDDAIGHYRRALEVDPNNDAYLVNLGNLLKDKNDLTGATACYKRALEINPGNAWVHSNLGNVMEAQGRPDESVASHRRALETDPGNALFHSNLGIALKGQGRLDEAIASHELALEIDPGIASIHNNLGYALEAQGRMDEAIASYKRALAIQPDYDEAYNNLGSAFHNLGQSNEAVASYRKALAVRPNSPRAQSNLIFCLNHIPDHPPADSLSEARQFGTMVAASVTPIRGHANSPDPERRLRIGLVSGDLRQHSVSYFLETVLAEIDTEKLELFAYATSGMEDDLTDRLKSIVGHWRNVAGMGDAPLAEAITADGIDILVDLSGHTAHNRLTMFAHKPAPLQVTWLGYGGTTGVAAMDYILCDPFVLPPADEAHFTEKPWRLPDAWICFSPPDLDIDAGPPPVLVNGFVTFGSFNNLTKVSDRTVACWAEVLEAIPDSRLLLKAKQLEDSTGQDNIHARFKAHGIEASRLTLKGRFVDMADHLRTYNEVDIALDTFPYAGGSTSTEAFWMGTPVLTMKGDRFVAHMGESLVHNMGLDDWIAETAEDYIEKAKAFASDPEALSALRESLRGRFLESPLGDAGRFAANLEGAFRGMWREWCA